MVNKEEIIQFFAEKFVLSKLGDALKVQHVMYHPDGYWIIDVSGRKARWIKKKSKGESMVIEVFPNIASFNIREVETGNRYIFEVFDVPSRKEIAKKLIQRIKEAI